MKLIYLTPSVSLPEALLVKKMFDGTTVIHGEVPADLSAFSDIRVYGANPPAQMQQYPVQPLSALFDGQSASETRKKFVIGITSCPTGVAHTYMAAEGLTAGASSLGYEVKIETQGSVGASNTLTPEDIARADVVIIAADTNVVLDRFAGKRLYQSKTKPAINDGAGLIKTAFANAQVHQVNENASKSASGEGLGLYKHLMTGVSHMLPFVVAGGLLIALGFWLAGFNLSKEEAIHIYRDEYKHLIAHHIFHFGKYAFALFVPVMSAFIGFSIAGRPALAPAMVGGYLADKIGAGFLGGILAGFLAGYLVDFLNKNIKLPKSFEALKPALLLPFLGVVMVCLVIHYVIGPPVATVFTNLQAWLKGLTESGSQTSALMVGGLIGGMMAVDMGGPINKAAYLTGTALLGSQIYEPMAAVMAGGMVPPIGIFLATLFFKNRFTAEEREAGKATGLLGLSFITEGAIPYAAKDPSRVIPALVIGSALTGALSMIFGCGLEVSHGGIFVFFAVKNLGAYILAILAGSALTAFLLGSWKKPIVEVG